MSETNDLPTTEEQTDEETPAPVQMDAASSTDVKDWDIADDDHPLVKESGQKAMKAQTEGGLGEFLSDFIYEADSAFVREYLQNSETACIRAAKYLIRNHPDYGPEWLTREITVRADDGERFEVPDEVTARQFRWLDGDVPEQRTIEVPRPLEEVVQKARDLGYDPTINVTLHRDERKLVWEDNGIGMTAYEADKAFMTNFNSGSAVESDTGGKFGVGAKSHGLITGKDAGMDVLTRTRRTEAPDEDKEGFKFHAYLGGATAVEMRDDEMSDEFRGTRFVIPIQPEDEGGPNLDSFSGWMEKYTKGLSVPVSYEEKSGGETPYDNEWEGTTFPEMYDNPPVVVKRPGEFTAVAGPDISGSQYRNDCYLVSMPIDPNNRHRGSTMWNMRVQIHDEQGLIIAGPNRGKHKDEVDQLHPNDVVTPEPVGSRDSLQKDDPGNPEFFKYVSNRLVEKEWEEVADFAESLFEADKAWEAIREDPGGWRLFAKMVDYHGYSRTKNEKSRFKNFINKKSALPDVTTETAAQVTALFKEVEVARSSDFRPSKKKNRTKKELADILADKDPDKVFMAASTGGAFMERYQVVYNTFDSSDATILVVDGSRKYGYYKRRFGFHKLKEVPRTKDADHDLPHDFDVPDSIHEDNIRKGSSGSGGKPDEVAERTVKFRTDSDSTSIDKRLTVGEVKKRLEGRGKIGGRDKVILFTRGDGPNISNNYSMSKYGAIACVSKAEMDELIDYDRVFTSGEFIQWSRSTAIATTKGARQADNLGRDGEMLILAYAPSSCSKKVKRLLKDENEGVRQRVMEDLVTNTYWYDEDDFDRELVFGVMDHHTFTRAKYALKNFPPAKREIMGWRPTHHRPSRSLNWSWSRLDGSLREYRFKDETDKWDDESEVYDLLRGKSEGDLLYDLAIGLHDHHGIDPTKLEGGSITEAVEDIDPGLFTTAASSDN